MKNLRSVQQRLSSVLSPQHDISADADLASQQCLAFLKEFSGGGGGGDGSASTAESTTTSERPSAPSPKSKQNRRRRFRRRRKDESESKNENVDSGNNVPSSPRKRKEKRRRHGRKSRRDDNDKGNGNNRRSCSRSRRRDESTPSATRNRVVEEDSAIARDFEMVYKTLPPVEAARQIMMYLQGIADQEQDAIYLDPDDVSVVSSLSGFDSIHSGAPTVCCSSSGDDSIPPNNRPPIMDIDVDRRKEGAMLPHLMGLSPSKHDRSLESLIDDDDDCIFYFA